MLNRVSYALDMSSSDHSALIFALYSARRTKQDILSFYEDNPDEKPLTPLAPLRDDIASLDRLIHIFQDSGAWS
ncbi:MAG: hypothetical protein HFI92_03785 [Lachnospiraceae bacterium]|nr:hypothetical protein [Lachnospiraceae bacterium]